MLAGKVIGVASQSYGGYRRYSNSRRYWYVTMHAKYYLLVELENGRVVSALIEQKSRNQSFEIIEVTKKRLEKKYLEKKVTIRFGQREYLI